MSRTIRLVVSLFALLLPALPCAAADWFVAPGAPTGDGSRAKPFHDPWRALAVAAPGDAVHIAAGVYYGRHDRSAWEIDRPRVTILGGYDAGFARRDPWTLHTVLAFYPDFEGTSESNLLLGRDDHAGVVIDGIVFDGGGRNRYDDKAPKAFKSGLQSVGPLLSVASSGVTVRNCVFINSSTGAVEARGDGFRFENNIVANQLGQPMLSLRDPPGGGKTPALIKGNTFAFAFDASDPPMGRGGEKGTAIRVGAPATIDGNVFIGSGNAAISLFTQAQRVAIDRNVFWLSLRANVVAREGGRESLITDKNLEEIEDLGFKSCAGNTAADAGVSGLPGEWVDFVTHHLLVGYATPPKENLAKFRASFGLAEKPASGMPEGGVISPYLDVAAACGVRVKSDAGARPAEHKVSFAAAGAAAAAPTYEAVHWAELATGNASLDGRRVEIRCGLGQERHGFVLQGITQEKHLGFDVMHPGGDGVADQLHVYAVRHGAVHRQFQEAGKSNNSREIGDWYVLRGVYRMAGTGRQKATLEVEQIVAVEPPPKPKTARPQGRDWFVRAGATGGDGSRDKPFRDPFQALEKAEGGDSIHVAGGDYFGKLRSASWKVSIRNLSMLGGYDASFGTRDPWKNPTRLVMTPDVTDDDRKKHTGEFLEATTPCDGFILDGFVFDGSTLNGYFDAASGGSLNLRAAPIASMVQLLGANITVRNCVFANASGAAVDLSATDGVFENNVIVNTSGTALNIVAGGAGPWIIRQNTFLFACDPTQRAGTGMSTSAGSLLVLRGRCAARIERNVFAFADNAAIRATIPREKLFLQGNAFVANAYCHFTDANRVWLFDAAWDRRAADSGLGAIAGNALTWPGTPVDRSHLDKSLSRLFGFTARNNADAWAKIAAATGATVKPQTSATTAPAEAPKPAEKPKEQSLEELMAELNKVKADTGKPAEAPKGPPYCPVYPSAKAVELAASGEPAVGARRLSLQVAFSGTGPAEARTYEAVTFAQIAAARDPLAGKAIELQAKRPRSSGSGGVHPKDLPADSWIGYQLQTLDDSVARVPVVVFIRRDSAAERVVERAVLTDTLLFKGVARIEPSYRGLVIAVDSVSVVEGK